MLKPGKYETGLIAAGVFVLAMSAGASRASLSPATWVSDQIIGVSKDAWISVHVERYVSSYYKYRTKSEIRVVRTSDGCILNRAMLGEAEQADKKADGNWSKTQISKGDPVSALKLITAITPMFPSAMRNAISIDNGAVYFKKTQLVKSENVRKWAALQGGKIEDTPKIIAVFETTDTLRGDNTLYLELQTSFEDIDFENSRFIIPLKFAGPLYSGNIDTKNLAAIQPRPTGC